MGLKPGQVYIAKEGISNYAIIVQEVGEEGSFSYRDTSSMDIEQQFSSVRAGQTQEDFLGTYELATPRTLEPVMRELREKEELLMLNWEC